MTEHLLPPGDGCPSQCRNHIFSQEIVGLDYDGIVPVSVWRWLVSVTTEYLFPPGDGRPGVACGPALQGDGGPLPHHIPPILHNALFNFFFVAVTLLIFCLLFIAVRRMRVRPTALSDRDEYISVPEPLISNRCSQG
jgi:hypothetical protein